MSDLRLSSLIPGISLLALCWSAHSAHASCDFNYRVEGSSTVVWGAKNYSRCCAEAPWTNQNGVRNYCERDFRTSHSQDLQSIAAETLPFTTGERCVTSAETGRVSGQVWRCARTKEEIDRAGAGVLLAAMGDLRQSQQALDPSEDCDTCSATLEQLEQFIATRDFLGIFSQTSVNYAWGGRNVTGLSQAVDREHQSRTRGTLASRSGGSRNSRGGSINVDCGGYVQAYFAAISSTLKKIGLGDDITTDKLPTSTHDWMRAGLNDPRFKYVFLSQPGVRNVGMRLPSSFERPRSKPAQIYNSDVIITQSSGSPSGRHVVIVGRGGTSADFVTREAQGSRTDYQEGQSEIVQEANGTMYLVTRYSNGRSSRKEIYGIVRSHAVEKAIDQLIIANGHDIQIKDSYLDAEITKDIY